ncbi:hypothetical protein MMPV_007095 [Pyropia vietnamensis]
MAQLWLPAAATAALAVAVAVVSVTEGGLLAAANNAGVASADHQYVADSGTSGGGLGPIPAGCWGGRGNPRRNYCCRITEQCGQKCQQKRRQVPCSVRQYVFPGGPGGCTRTERFTECKPKMCQRTRCNYGPGSNPPQGTPPPAPTPRPTSAPTPRPTSAPTPRPTRAPTPRPTPVPTSPPPAEYRWGDGWRQCTAANFRTRQNIRSLSANQKQRLAAAFNALISRGLYTQFTRIHRDFGAAAHGGVQFLPWHRLFVLELEQALRSIDPSVVLPFWDFTSDWNDPVMSPVFNTDILGGGVAGGCIPNGPYANLQAQLPTPHCVTRGFNSGPNGMGSFTFDQPGTINALIDASGSFADFANAWELAHGAPHVAIGGALLQSNWGDMFLVAQSPNDPAFFIGVHSNTDRVWWLRQRASGNPTQYDGQHQGRTVSPNDALTAFGSRLVSDTFNLPCVGYDPARTGVVRSGRRVSRAVASRRAPRARAAAAALLDRWAAATGISNSQRERAQQALDSAAVEADLRSELNVEG